MKFKDIKIVEYGPHDRYAKVGNTTVRANTRTGKQSVNTKVGDLELDADNTLNKDGSQGRMSATYKKDNLKLKHDTRKGMSASYKMPDGTTATASNSGKGKTKFKVSEHGGRIVKGVNTTADVGTDEIKKQAAKFGNSVDKDGRPPTLSKKVKGKSTNVLFNLGLAEGNRQRNLIDFVNFCKDQLSLKSSPPIKFVSDTEDTTFGYFDNDTKGIVIQNTGRHQMDVMRTVAHELVHYKQDQAYDRELNGEDGSPDENQANALAGVILRRWGQKNPTLFTESVDGNTQSSVYFTNMQEQLGEIAKTTEIYVDMDGVLADFFGEWTRLMNVDHWSKIDNDGLPQALQKIRDTDEFWLRLPILPQAKELLTLIKNIKGEYNICSSPLQDDPNSEPHKREWIKKNLSFFPPKNIYITHNKPQYAKNKDGTPNILIDDFGRNVKQWEDAGGIGFKYKDHKFERTAKQLQKHITESYTRSELPQITKKHLKTFPHKLEAIKLDKIIPVQKERLKENYIKQIKNIQKGNYNPIIVDSENKIINGHHRYDVIKKIGMQEITVAKLPITLEQILEKLVNPDPKLPNLKEPKKPSKYSNRKTALSKEEPVEEAFDTQIDWEKDPEDHSDGDAYIAYIGRKEVGIQYFFEPINAGGVIVPGLDITFEVNGTTKKTGGGDASTIFGAVINHIKQFINQHDEIDAIQFSASKEQGLSRTRLYSAMVDKLSQGTDWINAKTLSKADKSIKNTDMFKLVRRSAVNDKMMDIDENFAEPQFDIEWEEANRYPFLDKLGKDGWIELAQTGKVANVNSNIVKKIGNTGADGSETLADLEPEKVQRLKKAMKSGTIEMPIVMKMPNGKLELIAGNTRLIGLISTKGKAKVWYIDASKLDENFADGKKKGKSRPGRVKKSGASCNGSVTSLRKKAKKASGEKAKMYHWCANMKSGKKK